MSYEDEYRRESEDSRFFTRLWLMALVLGLCGLGCCTAIETRPGPLCKNTCAPYAVETQHGSACECSPRLGNR